MTFQLKLRQLQKLQITCIHPLTRLPNMEREKREFPPCTFFPQVAYKRVVSGFLIYDEDKENMRRKTRLL